MSQINRISKDVSITGKLLFRATDTGGAASSIPQFSGEKIFFLQKIGVITTEGIGKKATKNNIGSRACSQKSDVSHTISSMYFLL